MTAAFRNKRGDGFLLCVVKLVEGTVEECEGVTIPFARTRVVLMVVFSS